MVPGLRKLCLLQGSPFKIRENTVSLILKPDESIVHNERIHRVLWRLREAETLWPDDHWEDVRKRRSRGRGTQADDFDLLLAQYRALLGKDHRPGELGCGRWPFEVDDVDDITTLMRHVDLNPGVRIILDQEELCNTSRRVLGLVDQACHSKLRNRLALEDESDVSVVITSNDLKKEALLLGAMPSSTRMALLRPIVSALALDIRGGRFHDMGGPVDSVHDLDVIATLRECVRNYRCVYKQRRVPMLVTPQDVIRAVNTIIKDCLGVLLVVDVRDTTRAGRRKRQEYTLEEIAGMEYFNFCAAGGRERCSEMLSERRPPRAPEEGEDDFDEPAPDPAEPSVDEPSPVESMVDEPSPVDYVVDKPSPVESVVNEPAARWSVEDEWAIADSWGEAEQSSPDR
jgi:hypothetical protein